MPSSPHLTDPAHAAILAHLTALHAPRGEAERHCVEELAFAAYRQRRLRALEDIAFNAIEVAGTNEPEAAPCFRSLAVLARYRARVDRDHRLALAELDRLRLLAEIAEEEAVWASSDTDEPEPAPATAGRGTNEPEHRVARPNGPGPAAPTTGRHAPNRHERRRAAALDRERARKAA